MESTDPSDMSFERAFELFIKDRKVVGWGFRQPHPILLKNGFKDYPCGYYTEFDNGYKFIANGFSIGSEHAQEARILDPNDMPVGYKDREDIIDQGS